MIRDVTRLDAVRAGVEFPGFIEVLRRLPDMGAEAEIYTASLAVLRHNLSQVFQNPSYPLDTAAAEYLANRGSNEVLDKAFHGLPAYIRDWFRVGQVAVVALEARSRGIIEPDDVDVMALDNQLTRGGVPESDRRKLIALFHLVSTAAFTGGDKARLFSQFDNQLQQLAAQQDKPIMKPNIWLNGSFFLVALLSIFVAIRVLSGQLAPIWIAVVFVGGILAVLTIGILALRANEQINDQTFLQSLQMVLQSLPLIGRVVRKP